MKRKSIIVAAALVATVGAAALAFDPPSFAQPYGGGWGYMGPGMMGGYGPGWMMGGGPGWRHGGYGPCWRYFQGREGSGPAQSSRATPQQQDLKLTTDDVKARMERWLAWRNNPRLKLGDVKEKNADTITADIVTVDNSLVQRFEVNRHTGFMQRSGS